ncbi:hypothetical protein B0H11DRAFT_2262271 [Mycena galericulata]|nr:hypothetical protein B0H11DRAFT_2262271 [Mycena galericulata]
MRPVFLLPSDLAIKSILKATIPFLVTIVALLFSLWFPAVSSNLTPTGVRQEKMLTYALIISSVVADAVITIFLVVLLWTMKSFPVPKITASVVYTLMVYAISTGAVTSLGALSVLLTYLESSGLAYIGVRMVIGKLYINAFLVALNQRQSLQSRFTAPQPTVDPTNLTGTDSIEFATRYPYNPTIQTALSNNKVKSLLSIDASRIRIDSTFERTISKDEV